MKFLHFIYMLALVLLFQVLACKTIGTSTSPNSPAVITKSLYPTFSWDKMPLYMHLRKVTDYTDEELDYLSKFPLITLEKTSGFRTHGGTEKGSIAAAKAIKAVNPNAKVLYYRNTVINWPHYEIDELFFNANPDAYLKTKDGSYALMRNNKTRFFDISQEKVKNYWLTNAIEYTSNPYIDGIFIDANLKILTKFMKGRGVEASKQVALKAGYDDMMTKLQDTLKDKRLIISNILRVRPEPELANGLNYIHFFDGAYLEGFESEAFGMSYEEYLAKGIETTQKAARDGKIIAMTLGLGEAKQQEIAGIDDRRQELKIDENFNNRLDYLLAIFLVCAEKYSYVYPHDGYDVNKDRRTDQYKSKVWLKTFEQYEKPLGKPKGYAQKEGYIYTRSFEHLDVWLDIQNKKAKLHWKK